jgi:hypothetical protein
MSAFYLGLTIGVVLGACLAVWAIAWFQRGRRDFEGI